MVAKTFTYRGKTLEEMQKMSMEEFSKLLPSRERRKIKRGFTEVEKKFLEEIKKDSKNIKTQVRDMIILPQMVGITIKIYNGREWTNLMVEREMLGHRLGEFSQTRKKVEHSAPGIGATKSSSSLSVR